MKLIQTKTTEGTFEELIPRAQTGDHILLYEGDWDNWESHPQGVVIEKGNRLLLNGKELLYEGDWNDWKSHPQGVVIEKDNRLLLNRKELLYEGDWDNWESHPQGVVIQKGNRLLLYVYKEKS